MHPLMEAQVERWDYKDYRAPLGAFQLADPEAAVGIVCWLVAMLIVFRDYLR